MSYILDALKKMEHEKAKKKGTAGMTSVSGELFRPEKFKPSKGNIWKIGAAIVLVAILTSGVTWYLLRDNKSAKTAKVVQPVQVPATPQGPPAEAVVPPVVVAAPTPAAALPAAPVAVRQAVPVVKNVTGPQADEEENRRSSRKNSTKTAQRKEKEETAPVQGIAAPTDIKVSGIAWQDERAARRAVVNGFLLKEGAVVGGAKIVEILPEKVRFSMAGRTFELSMHSSSVQGAVK